MTRRELLRWGASAAMIPLAHACRARPVDRPNLVLVTLDTTRADHLGCYGYARTTSPNLDAMAAESTVFTRALAPATWTLPSHASLFTGKCPTSHGARYDPEGPLVLADVIPNRGAMNSYRVRGLSPTETTLAGLLAGVGYRTGGVAGGPWLKRIFGLNHGFEWWDDDDIGSINGRVAAGVNARALPWLETTTEPFFLFLNYFDAHEPQTPPPGYAERFLSAAIPTKGPLSREQTLALYDGEILYADEHFGAVVAALKRRGLYDRTWFIVTADHGHLFGEHGVVGHGDIPHQEVLHIPLVSKPPYGDGGLGERADSVQLTDVLAMVVDRLALPRPDGIQGAIPPQLGRPIVIESQTLASVYPRGDWLAIVEGDWKLMWNSKGASALYDLAKDPHENQNVIRANAARAAALEQTMKTYLAALPRPQSPSAAATVDAATREALKNLGYIH